MLLLPLRPDTILAACRRHSVTLCYPSDREEPRTAHRTWAEAAMCISALQSKTITFLEQLVMLRFNTNAPQDTAGPFCWSIFNFPSTETSRLLSPALCIEAGLPHNTWRIQHLFFSYHWQLSSSLVFPHVSVKPLCPQETSVFFQLQSWACSDSTVGHGVSVASGNPVPHKCALTFPHPGGWGREQKIKLTGWDKKSLIIEIKKLINY